MNVPSVLIRKSTEEIIKYCDYPRDDMSPVEGLDPDLEYLIIYEPYTIPDYDNRLFTLSITKTITETSHPDYPDINTFEYTYTTSKKDINEITERIKNEETFANSEIISCVDINKITLLALSMLIKENSGLTLTDKETAMKTEILDAAEKIWFNDENVNTLIELINVDEPNIDEGWVTE